MARPREFDSREVLEEAMRLFWEQGYHATSIEDLMRAMRLSRQSLYLAFGGKRSLFLQALAFYREQRLPALREQLDRTGSARAAIEEAVRTAADPRARRGSPLGCLVANTALEIGDKDAEIAAELRKMFAGYERLLTETIRRGQREGSITRRFAAEAIAQSLRSTLDGVAVLQKAGAAHARIKNVVELALAAIGS